jgi:hypothetical protein
MWRMKTNVAPRVSLRVGEQTGADALAQTFNGPDMPLRLVEGRPHHRLGEGPQEAGAGYDLSAPYFVSV